MRAVVQKVTRSSVAIGGETISSIENGLLVFLGVGEDDTEEDLNYLIEKIVHLRIFKNSEGKMDLSLLDVSGELLCVSQFTLYGDCRKGRRPSFSSAGDPKKAKTLYDEFLRVIKSKYSIRVQSGVFQEHMEIEIINDGPVTMLLSSDKTF